jgi:hypothetical protein
MSEAVVTIKVLCELIIAGITAIGTVYVLLRRAKSEPTKPLTDVLETVLAERDELRSIMNEQRDRALEQIRRPPTGPTFNG